MYIYNSNADGIDTVVSILRGSESFDWAYGQVSMANLGLQICILPEIKDRYANFRLSFSEM
jgi:hypothetical protein